MRSLLVFASVLALACGTDSGSGNDTEGGTAGTGSDGGPGDDLPGPDTSADVDGGTSASMDTGTSGEATGPDPSDSGPADTGTSTGGEPDGPDVDLTDPQLYEFELDPLALDPTVVDNIALQYAHLDTRAAPLGKLVFFLSGYTNTPAAWRNFGRQLAGYGFHVVEPHYNNSWTCDTGGSCNADTRWEALTGEDTSTVIDTSVADSAEGRVITMLNHLITAHPGGDWGYYLNDDGTLRDEHVIIAGISHGASSTGLFASRRAFHRAVMHSGGWGDVGDAPATPIDDYYGLSHSDDDQHAGHLAAWDQAGLPGDPIVADATVPPYDDSHRLIVSTPNGYPHCSVVVSPDSPIVNDQYVFDPVWRTMYGAPAL